MCWVLGTRKQRVTPRHQLKGRSHSGEVGGFLHCRQGSLLPSILTPSLTRALIELELYVFPKKGMACIHIVPCDFFENIILKIHFMLNLKRDGY